MNTNDQGVSAVADPPEASAPHAPVAGLNSEIGMRTPYVSPMAGTAPPQNPATAPSYPMPAESVLSAPTATPTTTEAIPAPPETTQPPHAGRWVLVFIGGVVLLLILAGALTAFWATGMIKSIGPVAQAGVTHTQTESFPANGISSANTTLKMSAGEILVNGGATGSNFANATLTYNVDQWKPAVNYNTQGGTGTLNIQQPDPNVIPTGNVENRWDLRLSGDVPSTIDADLGAGTLTMALGGLQINRLTVNNATGTTDIDLTGKWQQDLTARIIGNVGSVTLRLPADTGVRVTANNDLGKITTSGLTGDGNVYTNDVYGKTPVTLNIEVTNNVGGITLLVK